MKSSLRMLTIMTIIGIIAVSCVNDGSIVEGNTGERAKKTLTVLGYGFEKGENSSGTELAARQFAIVSLGEQVKGARFEYTSRGEGVEFSMISDAVIPGMREYYKHTNRVNGKYYAISVMGAEIEIEYPRPYGVFVKSYKDSGDSIVEIMNAMKARAVRECVKDKLGAKIPSRLSGRLYVSGLDMKPDADGTRVTVEASISLVFDVVNR
jgi:hypothetical protein